MTIIQLKHAIEIVCYKLLVKFKFGPYELDDMKQEAYILALEVLATGKYDEARPLTTFLYVHIHNRLYNFKRKHYSRLTPPCSKCPLNAYSKTEIDGHPKIPSGGCCLHYTELVQCKLYNGWLTRNEAKRQLSHVAESVVHPKNMDNQRLDTVEYLDWVQAQLPPEHIGLFVSYRDGKRVNQDALSIVLDWIQNNIVLDY